MDVIFLQAHYEVTHDALNGECHDIKCYRCMDLGLFKTGFEIKYEFLPNERSSSFNITEKLLVLILSWVHSEFISAVFMYASFTIVACAVQRI